MQSLNIYLVTECSYITCNSIRKQIAFLHNGSAFCTPPREIEPFEVGCSYVYTAFVGSVVTKHKFDKGCFAATAGSYYGSYLTLRYVQVDVVEYVVCACSVVFER